MGEVKNIYGIILLSALMLKSKHLIVRVDY